MRVYGMTHGDALVILKNKQASRREIVKALDVLLTINDSSELNNLEKTDLRRLIEFVTEQKMLRDHFNDTTKEELLIELKEKYFASLEKDYRKAMNIDEAEKYLRDYVASNKNDKLSDAIETILWTFLKNKRKLVELETLTKDFQIGTIKHRHMGKKVEK